MNFNFKIFFLLLNICMLLTVYGKRNYLIEIEKGLLTYANKDLGKDVQFSYVHLNKSHVSVSASFTVIPDDVGSDGALSIEAFRWVNNAWKQVPLPPVEVNLCDMFKKNSYVVGLKDLMAHGNITPCDVKPTHYYVKDYMPDLDFPPLVPAGKYIGRGIIKLRKTLAFKMDWYATLTRT